MTHFPRSPDYEVDEARAAYVEARRRLRNVVRSPDASDLLLELTEEFGSDHALERFNLAPPKFGAADPGPLLQPRSQHVLLQILGECERTQWSLDAALTKRERQAADGDQSARFIFDFGGREAHVDFEAGMMTFLDGAHETLQLSVTRPERRRRRGRGR